MSVHEDKDLPGTTTETVDYVTERGKPMPSLNHGSVQTNLILALGGRFKERYRIVSELSLDLSDWPSVPDISLYNRMPLDFKNDIIAMTEPPIGVIEIISPTQSLSELTSKARDYFKHGVKSCWIVLLPLMNIHVFSSPDDYEVFRAQDVLRDTVLDIEIPLNEVFEV